MTVVLIIAALVIIFVVLSLIGPKTFTVDRSLVINRNRGDVYKYVKNLKSQNDWGPWARKDPDMERSYHGTDGEVGFVSAWRGNKRVGEGEQEILRLVENERIESALRFFKPWKMESTGFINLEDAGENSTRVTWGFTGENKTAVSRAMGALMNMDKAVGKDFEAGLDNLREVLEK